MEGKRDRVSVSEAVATKERQRGVTLALLLSAARECDITFIGLTANFSGGR